MRQAATLLPVLLTACALAGGCLSNGRGSAPGAGEPPTANGPGGIAPFEIEELTVKLETAPAQTNSTAKIKHAAVGAKVSATSTHKEWPGEGAVEALVDGNMGTRWSSDYSAPQCVTIDLGKAYGVKTIRLHWEHAFAARYTVSTSMDGKKWAMLYAVVKPSKVKQPEVDTLHITGVRTRHIELDLEKRVDPEWGFSLYEVEIETAD